MLDLFSPATRAWFEASFAAPTDAQRDGWPAIADGRHTLIHAPTGSGKTLAAFLWTLDRILHEPIPPAKERCRVLYISPLKALAYDIDRNLRAPLIGIQHAARRLGLDPLPDITTFIRTGDTPADERRRMERHPPDVLITTPESLYLLLTSQARAALRSVRWVIVDEVHAVAGTKRGTHLALSLERLEEITAISPQRIGLSATQRPLEVIGSFLGGGTVDGGTWTPRPVHLIDVPGDKALELELVVPVEDMTAVTVTPPTPLGVYDGPAQLPPARTSVWTAIYPTLLEHIRSHQSTIVFANSRRLAERICDELNRLAGEEVARAHHGSVSREQRVQIEEMLKKGELPAVVATSSLELGIDMGAVDLVLQIESPTSVASGLQRVGRAGHQVGAASRAKIFPKYRGDLLVATVVVDRMLERAVESTRIPRSPLDVLAQHIVAMAAKDEWGVDELFSLVRRAAPYAELGRGPFEAVLDMLSGRYPSELFSDLRPRIDWDRVANTIVGRPGALQLAVQNPGTIPDRGLYTVHLPDGARVGELDEEMVYESRVGDVFILGASTWRINEITADRVEVVPAPGESGATMPFWHGDMLGRTIETGRALGEFTRVVGALDRPEAERTLADRYHLDELAASNLAGYLQEELEATGHLPSDETIVVERFRDEIGDWRLVLLSPFGARVHAPWAMALTGRFRQTLGRQVDVIWGDDGIALRFPDQDDIPTAADLLIDPDEIEAELVDHLADSAMFAARFREAAARSLLLPRRRPGKRTPLWLQRRRAGNLLGVVRQFGSFPIVLETYREILQDDFDVPALIELLGELRSRAIRVVEVELDSPSPFASSLLFEFVASFLYEGDTPLAERRAAALTLDRQLLGELLGEGELRQLLSRDVIATIELELQRLAPGYQATGASGAHDLLRQLGPLTADELTARLTDDDPVPLLADLQSRNQVIPIQHGGIGRWAAIEDAGRLRDAIGVQPPVGVPHVFLDPVEDPLGDVVARYARTHGPFSTEAASTALGLPTAVVATALAKLEESGRAARGAFRAEGSEREWVDTEVLRRIKRRSLAALRSEIEPVDPAAMAAFALTWHGVGGDRRSTDRLVETVHQLQGFPLPASVLETDILPARMRYQPAMLDQLMLAGNIVWVGHGSLGPRDGKLSLYFRDQLSKLALPRTVDFETTAMHDTILDLLLRRGASFFPAIYESAGGGDPALVGEALWDLVWRGLVTNDTLAPVRSLAARKRTAARRGTRSPTFAPSTTGRWWLVSEAVDDNIPDTLKSAAWTEVLLERHGVVTRDGTSAEAVAGGFTRFYPILRQMEDIGKIRRGYFVEGMGGAQFALPGAVDRLRAANDATRALAATDPANLYGAAIPWPDHPLARPARSAVSWVVIASGALVAYVDRRRLFTYGTVDAPTARAIEQIGRRRGRMTINEIDGEASALTPLGTLLQDYGFAMTPRGLAYRGNK
ncbi:MAG: DEAD/DEAH box helicase [Acidimicrobiia bacterium]|nr:DEAD/DEAH box helicase [Acidimicrobiia bacterium]